MHNLRHIELEMQESPERFSRNDYAVLLEEGNSNE